jgi:hypothetical protein
MQQQHSLGNVLALVRVPTYGFLHPVILMMAPLVQMASALTSVEMKRWALQLELLLMLDCTVSPPQTQMELQKQRVQPFGVFPSV